MRSVRADLRYNSRAMSSAAIKRTPVPRVHTLSKDDFIRQFKERGRPVVIESLTEHWPARQKWTLDYIQSVAGEAVVPVFESQRARNRKHQHAPAAQLRLEDYFAKLRAGDSNLRLFFLNLFALAPKLRTDFEFPDMGLKLYRKLPLLFMGGKGAKVQMHFDIDLADILLCHFGAKKRVLLVSPEQKPFMYHVPFSFSALFDVDFERPDFSKYPALQRVEAQFAELNHGDVLYIPPGYWHYITYDDISFSMALRAFPRHPWTVAKALFNLVAIRTVEGAMSKIVGQPWNDRNERLAVARTNKNFYMLANDDEDAALSQRTR